MTTPRSPELGATAGLPAHELEIYHREGWLVPSQRLPADLLARARDGLAALIADNPGTRPERLVSAHIEQPGSEGVRGRREFWELATCPAILDVVQSVIGPDICLWGCQVFAKPARTGMKVPFHQDGHYWPIRPLATITVWVALDAVDRQNGCLRVIPRSHASKSHLEHEKSDDPQLVLNQAITEQEMASLPAPVDIELDPGQFSLHDVYLAHGSEPNTSDRRRAGVALRYMPTSSVLERHLFESGSGSGYTVDWANRPIFLVRGVDRSGLNEFTPRPASARL